jgi:hypothetical protein
MPFTKGQMQFTRSPGPPGIHPSTTAPTRMLTQNEVLNNDDLYAAAGQYLQFSSQWTNLAENALSLKIHFFDLKKMMLNNQHQAYQLNGFDTYETICEDLNILEKSIKTESLLDAEEANQRFERLSCQF